MLFSLRLRRKLGSLSHQALAALSIFWFLKLEPKTPPYHHEHFYGSTSYLWYASLHILLLSCAVPQITVGDDALCKWQRSFNQVVFDWELSHKFIHRRSLLSPFITFENLLFRVSNLNRCCFFSEKKYVQAGV